ncbi:hypothetical protein [Streptomyces sp. NRRL S-350]|uniref:hypothetical protein n=1 Tax=Streptomyces sp. NRRL S-350 TaxID=1463902 RepID=UPI0004C1E69B|nr:hypothetical protein [Streptomyces sp. NRRL S-350]
MAEGKRNGRRWLAAGAAAVVLAGAGWWWRSAQAPAELPASACWSVLTRADLKPLAEGEHGTFAVSYWLDDDGTRLRPSPKEWEQSCEVRRSPEDTVLRIVVEPLGDSAMQGRFAPSGTDGPLDFGPDVQGLVRQAKASLGFRCDNPETASTSAPYVEIEVGTRFTRPVPDRSHRAILDIALKTAKAVVASYPCSNPLHLPDSVPEVAANFPSAGP